MQAVSNQYQYHNIECSCVTARVEVFRSWGRARNEHIEHIDNVAETKSTSESSESISIPPREINIFTLIIIVASYECSIKNKFNRLISR